jgi:hypothetical protein
MAVLPLSPGLRGHRDVRVSFAAVAGIAAGCGAAIAILTQATAAVAVAVIGLLVMVITLRRRNPWLATKEDLTTLTISDDDLDRCLAAARRSATRSDDRETEVALDGLSLVLPGWRWRAPDVPFVRFRIREPGDDGWHMVSFDRPPGRRTAVAIDSHVGQRDGNLAASPWRVDASWRQLVALSWLRMQPFQGRVDLRPLPPVRGRRRFWEIQYRSTGRGESMSYRLRSTGLYRPALKRPTRPSDGGAIGGG